MKRVADIKVVLPEPTLGYTIISAAKLAITSDDSAYWYRKLTDQLFIARKKFTKLDIELIAAAINDDPIDTRVEYSDFLIMGYAAPQGNIVTMTGNIDKAAIEAERFKNDILQSIEIERWKEIPRLEHEICYWCGYKVTETSNVDEWECPNHGTVSSDIVTLKVTDHFN